jgi:hypothetical protein
MSHQCPFPVRSTDNRCGYRAGSAPGFTLGLALVAILSGYASLSDAAPSVGCEDQTLGSFRLKERLTASRREQAIGGTGATIQGAGMPCRLSTERKHLSP